MELTLNKTASSEKNPARGFAGFAWGVLIFNLLVIALGVLVRATGSGDGCGDHWPDCNGVAIPVAQGTKTLIEFSHRVSTALDGLLVLALVGWGAVKYRKSEFRAYVYVPIFLTLAMTLVEALVGRHLVRNGLVTTNTSVERAVWMSIHLVSTFVLLAALSMTAWWASGNPKLRWRGQGSVGGAVLIAFAVTLLLGISGAVTALGDTLFPVRDHADAVLQSLAPGAHFLVRLRLLHPYIAGSVGLYLLLIAGLLGHLRPSAKTLLFARATAALFTVELGLGFVNVLLRAPVWMQLVHLLMADLTWVVLLFLALAALAVDVPQVELGATATPAMEAAVDLTLGQPTLRDYVLLTKPRVISLLLFTTLAAMFIAADKSHPVTVLLFTAVAIGGYMMAGAANTINMVIDRDIDGRMKRTATRPTVTQKVPSRDALFFGLMLILVSFTLLWVAANPICALLSLAGLVFYVVIYTLLLKRRTWHNIVIGGAAGAFPPLVGWAAVTGSLSPLAWYLFAIVLLWTPAHFWALALLIKDDYAEAGIPMLPVVLGDRITVIQIGLYAVLTAIVSVLPLLQGLVGYGYVAAAVLLNGGLLWLSVKLYRRIDRPRASSLFHYSMVYLALLFLAMAIDRSVVNLHL